jgi:uncharacterized protein
VNKNGVKLYHHFDDGRGICLINVEEMTAVRIDGATARLLDTVSADPARPPAPAEEEALRRLGLLAEEDDAPKREFRGNPPAIRSIALFVTQRCNFDCVYCYGEGGAYGAEGEMDRKTARRAIDWLIERSGPGRRLGITFFGGEPLLNFEVIREAVSYAGERGKETGKEFRFTISTNGSLLDEEVISFVREHRINLNVGFDGLKEVQDRQRPFRDGHGSYDETRPRIERLLAAVPRAAGRATLMGGEDPFRAEEALREIGFRRVAIEVASPSLFGRENNRRGRDELFDRLRRKEETEAQALLDAIRARETRKIKQLRRGSYTVVARSLESFISHTRRYYFCGAGRAYAAVSASGGVYLCHRFVGTEGYRLGNIFGGGLERDRYQRSPLRSMEACSRCFARYVCAGGCAYDNLACGGSIFTPNERRCRLARRSVELLASLACRLSPEDRAYLLEEKIIPPRTCVLDF